MFLPFFVKNAQKELIACGLKVQGTADLEAWTQIIKTLSYIAKDQLKADPEEKGINGDAEQEIN